MNMFKKNGGFTLVELIVVIAILAILAAVAIPAYSGYISKAQEANDMTLLDSVKTAAVFAVMEDHPDAKITEIIVDLSGAALVVTADYTYTENGTEKTASDAPITDDVVALAGTITFKSGANKATLDLTAATPKWALAYPAAN